MKADRGKLEGDAIRIRDGEAVYQHRKYKAQRYPDCVMLTRVTSQDEWCKVTDIVCLPRAVKQSKPAPRKRKVK